jgi:hypothetical protein
MNVVIDVSLSHADARSDSAPNSIKLTSNSGIHTVSNLQPLFDKIPNLRCSLTEIESAISAGSKKSPKSMHIYPSNVSEFRGNGR